MEMASTTPVPVSWNPEDDLLLKNAVEAGASLNALAKGAVQFSRRYTLEELKDRWHSLLYDPDVAASASTRMVELELSGINPLSKFTRTENSKGNKDIGKRKLDSIRKHYYMMRKKFRSEFFNPTNLGFLDEPNLHDCNGHGADFGQHVGIDAQDRDGNGLPGHCISDELGLQESDLDILRNAFPEALGDMPVTSAIANSRIAYNSRCSISVDHNSRDGVLRESRFLEEFSTSLREERRNSLQPDREDREIPDALKDSSIDFEKCTGVKRPFLSQLSPERNFAGPNGKQFSTFNSRSDNRQNICSDPCGFGSRLLYHSPKSGATLGVRTGSTDFIDSSATSDGEVTDLPDSLLNLSNEDDILLMEVDGKDSAGNMCKANLKLFPGSPSGIPDGGSDDHESEVVRDSNTNVAVPDDLNPLGSEVENPLGSEVDTSSLHGPDVRSDCEGDVPSASALNPDMKQLSGGNIQCTLNTEDTEIPCNDDIFLLIHPSTSFASAAMQPIGQSSVDASSAGNKDDQRVNSFSRGKDSVKSFGWTNKVGPNIFGETRAAQPAVGSTAHMKVSGATALPLLPGDSNKGVGAPGKTRSLSANPEVSKADVLEKDIGRARGVGETATTSIEMPQFGESSSVRVAVTEPVINPSTSELEEPQSDDEIPDYSDVEAVILEMDLDPHDQDSYTTRQDSKYQSEDFQRTTVRLEQCARSGLKREMTPRAAFAILHGRHLKHYIRKTEVILGRSTEDVKVDIDLRKEGRANKISRRQAMIKMESDGSFCLKNLGKCSILVNGKSVDPGQSMTLGCSCLIEIRQMCFMFEMNRKYVKQYIYGITQNKGRLSKFEWSPERKR